MERRMLMLAGLTAIGGAGCAQAAAPPALTGTAPQGEAGMDVEKELKRLIGHREITEQLYRYQEATNRADLAALASFFGDAKIATVASSNPDELHGVVDGGKQFSEGFADAVRFYDGSPRVQYSACNPIVQFNDEVDKATCHAYYFIFQGIGDHDYSGQGAKPEFPLQVIGCGRYLDTYHHVKGRWQIVEREIYSDLSGDYSRHMRISPAEAARHRGLPAEQPQTSLKPQVVRGPVSALRGPR
jgi:hypothetical protein